MGVALRMWMVKVKEKYLKTKYMPAGILFNVNIIIFSNVNYN